MNHPRTLAATLVFICLGAASFSQKGPRRYPPTAKGSVVESLHGVAVADPYRWLEQPNDPAVNEWVQAQTEFSTRFFERLGVRGAIRARLGELFRYSRVGLPWREAGRLFFTENDGSHAQPSLYALDRVGDEPRLLFDPNQLFPGGATAVRDYVISPNGRLLAYAAAEGGEDAATEYVRELPAGRVRPDRVSGVWNAVCWMPDSRGYFYIRSPEPEAPAAGVRIEKELRYHLLGQDQSGDRLVQRWRDNYRWAYCMTSEDGRWEIVVAERGAESELFVMALGGSERPESDAPLVPLLAGSRASFTPLEAVGHTLYVATDLDAPKHKIIALDLTNGTAARPRTIVPEGQDVIENAAVAGGTLAIEYLVDASSRLRLFTLEGRPAGDVPLPGLGSLGGLSARASSAELFYSFRSFLTPATVYRFDLRRRAGAAFRPPRLAFDANAFETRQVFYTSKDGTRVPMFITARKGLRRDGTNPTFLTGYGGYGASITPDYRVDLPLWLEAGGIYAVANLRGGGEYGEAWHRAGMLDRKQTTFDDFIAAAEYLVSERYTSPRTLAIYGHSNGGLLVGAALTQRPDLFAAAVANAGHYDMLRYHRFTAGAGWISEYGSADDPEAFPYLLRYSPLHRVRNGACYPATLLLAADHDDRVVPSHSYKFAAALQAAQGCDRPILLRVARGASHSYASTAEQVSELADMWAFLGQQLGIRMAAR